MAAGGRYSAAGGAIAASKLPINLLKFKEISRTSSIFMTKKKKSQINLYLLPKEELELELKLKLE